MGNGNSLIRTPLINSLNMSLVFAAITPHPPMLIPSIGKEKTELLKQTAEAMSKLEQELYTAKPQIIFIISPHTSFFADSFSINAHTSFDSGFDSFGDLTTKKTWTGAPNVCAQLNHVAKERGIPVQSVSEEKLDHGAAVALYTLTEHLPDVKVIPVGFSGLDPQEHIRFGALLKDIIMASDKRIAVIASGDLSHCLTQDAPSGYNKAGEAFDAQICEIAAKKDVHTLTHIDQQLVADADECGYRSLLILMGILNDVECGYVQHSYEYPFGIGYLVGQYIL